MSMNGEHPWRDWLNVLVIFGVGLVIVMIIVRLLIKWAQRDDAGPKGGSDKHTG
jgi:uncharacterized membrane protein YidH (DUF202 family)